MHDTEMLLERIAGEGAASGDGFTVIVEDLVIDKLHGQILLIQ